MYDSIRLFQHRQCLSVPPLERLYRRKQCILLEEQAAVENAIDTLPPELRRLMRLRYLDGMTCEQVCVELPCSWDTFHRWHRKALAMLE